MGYSCDLSPLTCDLPCDSPFVTFGILYRLGKYPLTLLQFGYMSLVVKLEDDLGEHGEWVLLHGIVPANGDGAYPLLSGIDLFGKTVFNHVQMAGFLAEWDRVRDRARDESQIEGWKKVKEMAEACRDDRDLYLRFVGN